MWSSSLSFRELRSFGTFRGIGSPCISISVKTLFPAKAQIFLEKVQQADQIVPAGLLYALPLLSSVHSRSLVRCLGLHVLHERPDVLLDHLAWVRSRHLALRTKLGENGVQEMDLALQIIGRALRQKWFPFLQVLHAHDQEGIAAHGPCPPLTTDRATALGAATISALEGTRDLGPF